MKVTGYRINAVHNPADFERGGRHLILHLQTDEGIVGNSFAGRIPKQYLKPMADVMRMMLDELVVGQDPMLTEAMNARVYRGSAQPGWENRAASGIEAALWDLKGKVAGLPLYKLMGGYRDRVPTYASWRVEPRDDLEDLASDAARHVENGFRAMKSHIGTLSKQRLLDHVRVMRETVGDDIDILLDVNQNWTLNQALEYGRAVERYNPYWIEDPISVEDYDGMHRLTETLDARICAGERYKDIAAFHRLLVHRSVDIAMIDQDVGLTSWLKIAHMAEAFQIPVVTHAATEILVHLIAAVPNGLTVEYYPSVTPILKEPLAIEDGMLVLPDRPGLGLDFDEDLVARYSVN
jgi:L-talarate/galactarate dehydratase